MSIPMGRFRRRPVQVGAALVVGAVLLSGAAAWACTNVAVLRLDRQKARSGATIQGMGKYFRASERDAGPVQIHFNSLKGNVLTRTVVDAGKTPNGARCCDIDYSFKVPKVKPGAYTIVATQYRTSTGEPVYGTPARTAFRVLR